MNHLAVIPARSGSKGLKDKNIKLLAGKPLLQYTIQAAKESKIFDCIHVSTDDLNYASIAMGCGADVPFLRIHELAVDDANTWDTVRFVLNKYKETGKVFDMVTLLQPTSPLRDDMDIRGAYHLFREKEANAVVSVCETEYSPLLTNFINETLSLNGFIDLNKVGRRQDLPTYYRINGAIYMMETYVLNKIEDLYGKKSYAYIMPQERSVDIDNILDFKIAELLLHEKSEL